MPMGRKKFARILPEKKSNHASTSAAPKKTGVGQISKETQRNLEDACSDIENALDLIQIVAEG